LGCGQEDLSTLWRSTTAGNMVKVHTGQSSVEGQDTASTRSREYGICGLIGKVTLLYKLTDNQQSKTQNMKKSVGIFSLVFWPCT
jgi:hypothetical protein